jgi:hypothetical protein
MISRPHVPSDYLAIRLSICGALLLLVACFFLIYDGIAHRGTPVVPPMEQASHGLSNYALRQSRWDDIPAPDMKSQDVAFANADATPLAFANADVTPLAKAQFPEPLNIAMEAAAIKKAHHVATQPIRMAATEKPTKPKLSREARSSMAMARRPRQGTTGSYLSASVADRASTGGW